MRTGRARTRNGSTRCGSPAGTSGANPPIRRSSSPSMRGRAILNRPERTGSASPPDRRHDEVLGAMASVAPIPRGQDGAPVFREPWEAQAFAMALTLHERGLFTWTEWAEALSGEIRRAQQSGDCDDGSTYYRHWLAAIERLVAEKGVT